MRLPLLIASAALVLAGCADEVDVERPDDPPSTGISGRVLLGPQCPVESAGEPCDDLPAADVLVSVSEQIPGEAYAAGEPVATTRTDTDGVFDLTLPPGEYVVTADAGMSCELMDARVVAGAHTIVEVPCDTGIR